MVFILVSFGAAYGGLLPATQVYHEQSPDVIGVKPRGGDFDPHPQYKFAYDVQDTISGDSKRQIETRDGDVVEGEYSFADADGYRRTVQYRADPVNGFNAVVHREPLVNTVAEHAGAPKVAPLVYTAPAADVKNIASVIYAAHLNSLPYAAPVATPAFAATHH